MPETARPSSYYGRDDEDQLDPIDISHQPEYKELPTILEEPKDDKEQNLDWD